MNIVLIGYRCSGKTEVGKMLARELGKDFLDTDALIEENAGCSIDKIVSREGWAHFRKIEKEMIEEVSGRDNLVVATGGGIVMDEGNVRNLKRNGLLIWLKGDAEVFKERMNKDQRAEKIRPSLTGTDPLEEIKRVLSIRIPLYEKAGDLMVDTNSLSIRDVVSSIMETLPKGSEG
jgi:shikimate kinase